MSDQTPGLPEPVNPAPVNPVNPALPPAVAPDSTPANPTWPTPGSVPPPTSTPSAELVAVVAAPRTSGSAIAAFVLSIASWVVCPIIPAIIALVFAAKADRDVRNSAGMVTSSGLSTAAKIISWINIGVGAAGIFVGMFILLLALLSGGFGSVGQV